MNISFVKHSLDHLPLSLKGDINFDYLPPPEGGSEKFDLNPHWKSENRPYFSR